MGRDCSGRDTGRDRDRDRGKARRPAGRWPEQQEGDEVSAIVRRHRRLREDEEKVEREEAGVSGVMGVGLKAGQLEELGVREESQRRTWGSGAKRGTGLVTWSGGGEVT